MNHAATSREELLNASLRIAAEEGLKSLNIRSIARECNVSVGCVYRYFPSKADLMSAAVGKIWENIFHLTESGCAQNGFCGYVRWIFECIKNGSLEYPSFFSQHAEAFSKDELNDGRRVMSRYFDHIHVMLLNALDSDTAVRPEVFDETFTRADFTTFVFDNLLSLGMQQAASCDVLLRVIDKLIY